MEKKLITPPEIYVKKCLLNFNIISIIVEIKNLKIDLIILC